MNRVSTAPRKEKRPARIPLYTLREESVRPYLESLHAAPVAILNMFPLGGTGDTDDVKAYGYGVPVRVDYRVSGQERSVVIATISPGSFGHEHMEDRAQALLWNHRAFSRLPRHVRSLDVGALERRGSLRSLGEIEELFQLVPFVPGREYACDLFEIQKRSISRSQDLRRVDALADYLEEIHSRRGPSEELYLRRIRELVGHGECIMGLIDSYPDRPDCLTPHQLEQIEHLALTWRWRLKGCAHRVAQVHGDFHPWNVLFREGTDFTVLDRSRGEWGEPADDVTCMSLNYVFFSLLRDGRLEEPFESLFHHFWERYLEMTQDKQIVEVAPAFVAFRGLVMASPVWYPDLHEGVRRQLGNLIIHTLESEFFDHRQIHDYLQD